MILYVYNYSYSPWTHQLNILFNLRNHLEISGFLYKIMNDPSWIVAQHMKGFENLHLDDVDKKKDIVNVSGTIIFEIVNK